jgi:hypothetical protein
MNKDTNNIYFLTEEISLDQDFNINNEIEDILKNNVYTNNTYINSNELLFNDQLYYTEEFTVKELLKICKYYGIDKNIKSTKCKKQDIISAIIFFESLPENFEKVFQRNKMWTYMNELKMDIKMKEYILWN